MAKIGIIGCGNMGTMLVEKLCQAGVLNTHTLMISDRSSENSSALKARFPALTIASHPAFIIQGADQLFICTLPEAVHPIIQENLPHFAPACHLISMSACSGLAELAQTYPGPVSRLMPTVITYVQQGYTLLCHNSEVTPLQAQQLETLLTPLGKLSVLSEQDFDLATNFTSSGPALMATLLHAFIQESQRFSGMPQDLVKKMLTSTLLGTARMIDAELLSPEAIVEKVSTRGGITMEGVQVLLDELPQVYAQAFAAMQEKRALIMQGLHQAASEPLSSTARDGR